MSAKMKGSVSRVVLRITFIRIYKATQEWKM